MIVIAATFVAEPLQKPLSWLLEIAGIDDEIGFAPYNQIFQQLLDPTSELARNGTGTGVVLLRVEDFIRDLSDPTAARQTIERATLDLADALEKFASRSKCSLILCVLPPGPNASLELAAEFAAVTDLLIRRAIQLPGVQILDDGQIERVSGTDRYDAVSDKLAHIPYTESHFASIALALARKIHAVRVPAAKVLVLDCDNTLWQGVVGEDGIDGIKIPDPYLALQDFAVAQQEKGVLVCLASKNTEADVLNVFDKRTDMRLRINHVVSHRINWESKPSNIRALAAELNLGLDAFVFLDDNPVECALVRSELPQVITLQIPPEPEIPNFIEHLWTFDKVAVTAEDAARTRMYRENSARRAMESAVPDIGRFLAELDLKIDIAAPAEEEWPRIEQLTQRTNQFNFTTRRRTAAELKSLLTEGAYVLRVRVADRFGDYGLVGAIIAQQEGATLTVDTLLLSCRVLGRGVEHAMLRRLGDVAQGLSLENVSLPYIATARNAPARAFADSVAAEFAERSPEGAVYRIPVARAAATEHRPGHDPVEVIEARIADEKKGAGTSSNTSIAPNRSDRYFRLASVLVSGPAVLGEMTAGTRLERTLGGEVVSPATAVEAELLQVWEEVLNMRGLGVEDDFFSLGGTSLLSVKLFADIERRFNVQLRLTSILDAPTVRSLARLIASDAENRNGVVCLRRGGKQNLFLIHDGLGETLLYLNLAKRLPATISVYGIEPNRLPGIPLAHSSIEGMASSYVNQIREIQSRGPYLLGGMCAGGVIAYAMADCLTRQAERVQMVAIMDGATPQATKRVGRVTRRRLSRMEEALTGAGGSAGSLRARWLSIAVAIGRKARNVAAYEFSSLVGKISVRLRFAVLKALVGRGAPWPSVLPELSVMQIYNLLESQYAPPKLNDVPVLLVRATVGDGIDTPYRELYRDEHFGWKEVATQLEMIDVEGGHSSMLQEQAVHSLTSAMLETFPVLSGSVSELS